MSRAGTGGIGATLLAISVAFLSGCSSDEEVSSCPMDYSSLDQGVVVSVSGATPTSPTFAYPPPPSWVGTVCINGACMFDSAQSGAPIAVRDTAVGTKGPVVVTVDVADDAGRIGPTSTATVTPSKQIPNGPTCPPTNYVATVTVTPTR